MRTRIEDEEGDDADEERPKKRQAASFKFHRTVDPRGFLGAVIGKNGGTIKKLEKVTKTKMDVDQEAKTVEVKSDSARQTARGCELIESIIVSCERTKSERAAGKKTEKFVLGDILQSARARWNGDGDGDEKSAPEPGMNDAVEGSPEDTAAAEAGETPAEEPERDGGGGARRRGAGGGARARRQVSPGSPRRRSRRRMRRRRNPRRRMTRPRPSRRRRRRSLNPRRREVAAAGAGDEAPRRAEARRSEFFLLLLLQERLNQSSAFAYPRVPSVCLPLRILRICILMYPHVSSPWRRATSAATRMTCSRTRSSARRSR